MECSAPELWVRLIESPEFSIAGGISYFVNNNNRLV